MRRSPRQRLDAPDDGFVGGAFRHDFDERAGKRVEVCGDEFVRAVTMEQQRRPAAELGDERQPLRMRVLVCVHTADKHIGQVLAAETRRVRSHILVSLWEKPPQSLKQRLIPAEQDDVGQHPAPRHVCRQQAVGGLLAGEAQVQLLEGFVFVPQRRDTGFGLLQAEFHRLQPSLSGGQLAAHQQQLVEEQLRHFVEQLLDHLEVERRVDLLAESIAQ